MLPAKVPLRIFAVKGLGLGVSCFLLWSLWRIRVVGARCSGAWGLEF